MFDCIVKQDVHWWSKAFMEALEQAGPKPAPRLLPKAVNAD
jgi:hypothetical protein